MFERSIYSRFTLIRQHSNKDRQWKTITGIGYKDTEEKLLRYKWSYLCGAGASAETEAHLAMAGWGSTRDPKSDTSPPPLKIAQGHAKIRAHRKAPASLLWCG